MMGVRTKNRILSIVLSIVLVAVTSNAAVVSDNDGSAFITKAEFDSLKNGFQNQINGFNSMIDSKIDNAIASYLEGVKNETEVTISSLIGKDGVYGEKMKLLWNSSTSYRMISTVLPYPVHKYTYFTVITRLNMGSDGIPTNDTSFESGMWDMHLLDRFGNEVNDLSAGAKKEYRVETVKIGTTDYRLLRYVRVQNYFNMVLFFGFPTTDTNAANSGTVVTGWDTRNFLEQNVSKLTQKNLLSGQQMDYFRTSGRPSDWANIPYTTVMKTGNAMITQNYVDDFEHVYAPFSNIQEYVWDPNSNETMNLGTGSIADAPEYATNGDVAWIGVIGSVDKPVNRPVDNIRVKPRYLNDYYFTWQHLPFKSGVRNESGSDVSAKNSIIYNYYDIDNRNRYQRNGLVLGTTPDKNDSEVICLCSSDVAGTVYFYVGDNPIDNWTSSSFAGKKYTLVANRDPIRCTLGRCDANKTIWVLFRPTSTSVNGKLKVSRLFYIK